MTDDEIKAHVWPQRLLFSVVVVVFLFSVGVAWFAIHASQDRCNGQAQTRADNRAMWEYLVDQRPEDDPEVVAFVAELNKRLPRLTCGGPLNFELKEVNEDE